MTWGVSLNLFIILFLSRTIQTRSELYRLSLGSIITLTFSVLCNLDLLPADQLSDFHQFFSEKISSFLKGRMISKEINQGLYKAGPEFPFETLMTFKEGWNFSQFSLTKTEFSPLFLFCTFDLLRSLSFFYCGYLESTSTLVILVLFIFLHI